MFCNRPIAYEGSGPWGNITPKCLEKTTYGKLLDLAGPIIQDYRDDLIKHDRADIEQNPGIPFLHFTGQTGTHLVFLHPADHEIWPAPGEIVRILFGRGTRLDVLANKREYVHSMKKHHWQDLILYFTGKTFKKIGTDHAEHIIDNYVAQIKNEWNS